MEKWKCTVCGYIHEGPMTPDFKCPICKQPADKFVKIEDAAAPAKNPYAGTKTEKNLWEAFAGESQARNKYTYFASVAKKPVTSRLPLCSCILQRTRRSTPNCGSKLWVSWAILPRTCSMLLKVRTPSGRICMTAWLVKLMRKDSMIWLNSSVA